MNIYTGKFNENLSKSVTVGLLLLISSSVNAMDNATSEMHITVNSTTGNTNFITGINNLPLDITQLSNQPMSLAISKKFGVQFGVQGTGHELRVTTQRLKHDNGQHFRYQQFYQGLPVIGAEIVANTNDLNQVTSILGKTSPSITNLTVTPSIISSDATAVAISLTSKWRDIDANDLAASEAVLSIYDESFFEQVNNNPVLVWKIEVSNKNKSLNEFVVINAKTGTIEMHYNQVPHALNRTINTNLEDTTVTPSPFIVTELCSDLNANLPCSAANINYANNITAKKLYLNMKYSYDFYKNNHNRDGIENPTAPSTAKPIIAQILTFNTKQPANNLNAYWDGSTMNFTDIAATTDILAHEYTHGVTENTSNLVYAKQPGAINESFSDLWGELIDQTYNTNKTLANKWLMGDEVVPTFVVRNMKDPTQFKHPDKMTSVFYHRDASDNYGVHVNSGINNKAVYLMTDGDTFNNFTVKGIGIKKVAAIYYNVQTNLLTTSSDYLILYNAINKSCNDISKNANNSSGITAADCIEVKKAVDAVEMNLNPNTKKITAACQNNQTANNLFFDNMDTGITKWDVASLNSNPSSWKPGSLTVNGKLETFLQSDSTDIIVKQLNPYAFLINKVTDSTVTMKTPITLPINVDSYMRFYHSIFFSNKNNVTNLEYSIQSGVWVDANQYIIVGPKYGVVKYDNPYEASIYDPNNPQTPIITVLPKNPLVGKLGFTKTTNGTKISKLTLPSAIFGGKSIKFRWRTGIDNLFKSDGWIIDDVQIYTCAAAAL